MKRKHNTLTLILCIFIISILFLNPDISNSQSKSEQIIIGDKIVIHSDILNEDRTILIRLPKDYDNAKMKYPVLYILDGEFFF